MTQIHFHESISKDQAQKHHKIEEKTDPMNPNIGQFEMQQIQAFSSKFHVQNDPYGPKKRMHKLICENNLQQIRI